MQDKDWKIREKNRQAIYSVKRERGMLKGSYTVEMAMLSGLWLL